MRSFLAAAAAAAAVVLVPTFAGAAPLTGRVLDAEGEPAPIERVNVLPMVEYGMFSPDVRDDYGAPSAELLGDGRFSFDLAVPGVFGVWVKLADRSVLVPVRTEGAEIELRIRLSAGDGSAAVRFDDAHRDQERVYALTEAYRAWNFGSLAAHERVGSAAAEEPEVKAAWNALRELAIGTIEDENASVWQRSVAAVMLVVGCHANDASRVERIRRLAPPESPAWSFAPLRLGGGFACHLGDSESTSRYLEKLADAQPSALARAGAMMSVIRLADRAGDLGRKSNFEERLRKEYGELRDVRSFLASIAPSRLTVGKPLPPFSVASSAGPLGNETWKGKRTLLAIWAKGCGACKPMLELLASEKKALDELHIQPVSLVLDTTPEEALAESGPLPWDPISVQGEHADALSEALHVRGVPTLILLDEEGRVLANGDRVRRSGTKLVELLREAVAAAPREE